MQINQLPTIPQAPANADVLAIEVDGVTYKVSKSVLASAILAQLGGDPVTVAHGGTGATNAEDARENLGVPSNQEMQDAIAQSTAIVNASASNIAVASGAFRLDIAVTVPSGYTIAGVVAWNFGARVNVSITGIEVFGGYVRIFGTNNGASTTVSPTAKVLCVKQ